MISSLKSILQIKDEDLILLKTPTNEFQPMTDKNKQIVLCFLVNQLIIYERTFLGDKFALERNSHLKSCNKKRGLQMFLSITVWKF